MTRDEYIMSLARELSVLPEETRASALAFYTEMLDDRMEDGMDEESAVAAMENPREIARRLGAENPPEEKETADAEPLADEQMEFSSLVNSIMRSVQQVTDRIPEMVEEGIQTAQQRMEEIEDVSAGQAGDYEKKIFTCRAEVLRAISISAEEMPVSVSACDGEQAELIYYTSERDPYQVTLENGVLSLRSDESRRPHRGFGFSFIADHVQLIWGKSSPTIELHLPAQTLTDLKICTSNGSIKARELSALCDVDLHTSNSRIALENIRCKSLEMKTSNGRLALENVESRQAFRGKTSNSRIVGQDLHSGGEMILTTSNSSLTVEQSASGGAMRLTTSNGSVAVDRLSVPSLEIKTCNGNIRGTLPGRQGDWAIDSATSNGHNSLPRSQMGNKPLSAYTSNGSINLSFEE